MVDIIDANLNKDEIALFIKELSAGFGEIDEPADIDTFELLDKARHLELKICEDGKWLVCGYALDYKIFIIKVEKYQLSNGDINGRIKTIIIDDVKNEGNFCMTPERLNAVVETAFKHSLLSSNKTDNTADQDDKEPLSLSKLIHENCLNIFKNL